MKKVLFIIPRLGVGGAEKSLVKLLKTLDYSKMQVSLLLFDKYGYFMDEVPDEVQILYLNNLETLMLSSGITSIVNLFKSKYYIIGLKKIGISIIHRLYNNISGDYLIWKRLGKYFENIVGDYDVAISYLQGMSSYYTIDKVEAKEKIIWIHSDYDKYIKNNEFDRTYINQYDNIVTVSKSSKAKLLIHFPNKKENIKVIYNLIDIKEIDILSKESNELDPSTFNIVSVGRLHYAKGFDLAVPAIYRLINEGYKLKWTIIGEGSERKKIKKMINKFDLNIYIILLGQKSNPYTYMNTADIYFQPSRYEGYCITLAEALYLNKPVISTDFTGALEQINNMETGLITKVDSEEMYYTLKKLIIDSDLRNKFSENLNKNSKLDNLKEIKKINTLLLK